MSMFHWSFEYVTWYGGEPSATMNALLSMAMNVLEIWVLVQYAVYQKNSVDEV